MLLLIFVCLKFGASVNIKMNFPIHVSPDMLVLNGSQSECQQGIVYEKTEEIRHMICSNGALGFPTPGIKFEKTSYTVEEDEVCQVCILVDPTHGDVDANLSVVSKQGSAKADIDYIPVAENFFLRGGKRKHCIVVSPIIDYIYEEDEAFDLLINSGASQLICRSRITITIKNILPIDIDGQTNEGTLFAIAFLHNYAGTQSPPSAALSVLNNHQLTAVVEVSLPRNNSFPDYPQTVEISPNSKHTFLFSTARNVADIQVDRGKSNYLNKGIRVKSINNVPVSVIGSNSAYKSADTFLALPCQSATINYYEYFVFTSSGRSTHFSQIAIVPCEDTRVILSSGTNSQRFDVNAFQVHYAWSTSDMTGVIVGSRQPLAVFSGHQCGFIRDSWNATCDYLVEQIPMHAVWGNTFFTAPFGYRRSGEFYRIGSTLPGNSVTVTCSKKSGPTSLTHRMLQYTIKERGRYYQFQTNSTKLNYDDHSYRKEFCSIETSKPAIVMQYMPSSIEDQTSVPFLSGKIGDPSISILPPVKQYRSKLISTTVNGPHEFVDMATWTIPVSNNIIPEINLNGKNLCPGNPFQGGSGDYTAIVCTNGIVCGYGAFAPINSNTTGIYVIQVKNETNFGANFNMYGYNTEVSYSHSAGFKMLPIGVPQIAVYSVTVNENAGTVSVPFRRVGGDLSIYSGIYAYTRSVQGSAVAGVDYWPVRPTPLRWQSSATSPSRSFIVRIFDDNIAEEHELFEVLFNIDFNGFPVQQVARVIILDDDRL